MLEAMPDETPSVLYFGISCEDIKLSFDSRSEEPRNCCMELIYIPMQHNLVHSSTQLSLGESYSPWHLQAGDLGDDSPCSLGNRRLG